MTIQLIIKCNSKTTKDSDKVVQERKQEKAVTRQRKGRVLLVGDSLVRHVGRNLEQQWGLALCVSQEEE